MYSSDKHNSTPAKAIDQSPSTVWLARLVWRFWHGVIVAALLLSWAAWQGISQIRLDTGLEALMPDGVASVENLKQALEKTGSFASAMVVIEAPGSEAGQAAADRFAEALRADLLANADWVAAANYAEDFSVFESHKLLYADVEELRRVRDDIANAASPVQKLPIAEFQGIPVNIRIRSEPARPAAAELDLASIEQRLGADVPGDEGGQRRVFRSDDGRVTLLVVWPKDGFSGLGPSRQIIRDLRQRVADLSPSTFDPELAVNVGGRIYNRVVQFDAVMQDLSSSGLWSIGLIALLLAIYFRSLLAVPLIALPLAVGILWTFGLVGISVGQLNLVTVFLALILFGLGVDFGIHNLARYREERSAGADVEGALQAIFQHTGRASLMAAATTALGFMALVVTDFRAFYEFGLIAGGGVIMTFLTMYSLFPALLVGAEKLHIRLTASVPEFAPALGAPALKYPRVVSGMIVIIVLASVYAARDVAFENDFGRLQAERSPSHKAIQANISKVFPDGTDRAVLIVDSTDEVIALERYFDAYIAQDVETPTIKKIETVFSYLPRPADQQQRLEIIRDIRARVADIDTDTTRKWRPYLDVNGMEVNDLPDGLERIFTGLPGSDGHLVYIFNSVTLNRADLARQFADDIREIRIGDKTYHPAAEGLVFVDMLNLMKADALLAIALVAGTSILLIVLMFRSMREIIAVFIPPALGLVVLFGIMGIFDIRLSIFNMVVLPTLIGIGVDNGIHIVHRTRETGDIRATLAGTGGAAAITTLTTMLGFAGMLSASMGGLYSLGLLATIGLLACLVATLTALPAWLRLRGNDA